MSYVKYLLLAALVVLTTSPAGAQRGSRARIAPLPVSEWTDEHRQALGAMARGEQTIDVFKTCLRNLELCRNWMPFTRYILGAQNGIAPREKELLILRTAWRCNAVYDWAHHVPGGKRAGLTDDEIARLAKASGDGWSRLDQALLRAADELHADQHITDRTWAELKERYNDSQMADLIFTVGQYTMVSMFANAAGVQLEPGLPGFPQ